MKTTFLFIAILILFFITCCNVNNEKKTELPSSGLVSVITDITDQQLLQPMANPLLQLYGCNNNPDIACTFRIRTVSDKLLTPIITYKLQDGGTTEKQNKDDDPQFREKSILAFYSHVNRIVNEFKKPIDSYQSLNNSECLQTIGDELNQLTTDKSRLKYLVVFSDLNEKSDLYNVYESGIVPKDFENVILKNGLFPEHLENITVIFVFKPKDRQQDKQYSKLIEVYKKVIEQRGGKVFVQATNTSYTL
jgi:hypothetical protein